MSTEEDQKAGGSKSEVKEVVNDPFKPDSEFFYHRSKKNPNERLRVSKYSVILEHLMCIDIKYLKEEAISRNLAGISVTTSSLLNTANALLSHNAKALFNRFRDQVHEIEGKDQELIDLKKQLKESRETILLLQNELEKRPEGEIEFSEAVIEETVEGEFFGETKDMEGADIDLYSNRGSAVKPKK